MTPKILTETWTSKAPIQSLAARGQAVDGDDDRIALLEESLAGRHVELEVEAVVFNMPAAPMPLPEDQAELANSNFVRFTEVGLTAFARSFRGKVFLRDHNGHELEAKGGSITDAKLAVTDDGKAFVQKFKAVKPWAVQGILDGTIDSFSIGWEPKAPGFRALSEAVSCSVCGEEIYSFGDCPHWPGQRVVTESGLAVIVEAVWDSRLIEGKETSTVVFPAVDGTHVSDVGALAQLAEAKTNHEDQMHKLLKALGAQDEDSAIAEVERLKSVASGSANEIAAAELSVAEAQRATEIAQAAVETATSELAAVRESADESASQLAAVTAERDELAAQRDKQAADALVQRALSEGRIRPKEDDQGNPVETASEKHIRKLAAADIAVATEWVDGLPKQDPIDDDAQSKDRDDDAKPPVDPTFGLSAQELRLCNQMGVKPENYVKFNAPKTA